MNPRRTLSTLFLIGLAGACASEAPSFSLQRPTKSPAIAYDAEEADYVSPSAPNVQTEAPAGPEHNRERYAHIQENDFLAVADHPLSTFSIDVDTASYANVRRFLRNGRRPPIDAVRIEELINYFEYSYKEPTGEHPFSVDTEVTQAPWAPEHRLVRVALKGRTIERERIPPRNLVLLLDVSGSMSDANKLPLLKRAFGLLIDQLDENDRVSIVVYAGASGVVLAPTPGNERGDIMDALDELSAGGSTNGAQGIQLAYDLAEENFDEDGINRVILATDGDFNVGTTDQGSLIRLIEEKREKGIFLTVLGFGMYNLADSTMEALADKGNGNYAYIDTINEAKKVLVQQMSSTLITIAKDTKIQVELNPVQVDSYRLIGYENRLLKDSDFNDDTKDAGELGAGHTVTAIYEVVLAGGGEEMTPKVDPLKYQSNRRLRPSADSTELMTIKLRYKEPRGSKSKLLVHTVSDSVRPFEGASSDLRFASSVAAFGMLLRNSKYKGKLSFSDVEDMAEDSIGQDEFGYRREFVELVGLAADSR